MRLINFSKANCKNCYKCLRHCPVKAIRINNDQAEIIEERCIGCGQCLVVCPQEARNIKSDLEKIKKMILDKRRVIATIAPSYAGAFALKQQNQMVTALKSLGFEIVEETAIGAEMITNEYIKEMKKSNKKNMITTCCPAANYLVERYYPDLIHYMIPKVSPMIAHGMRLKQQYGKDSFVVFIGPCVAKKYEANDLQHQGIIDAVVTFEELSQWFDQEGIVPADMELGIFGESSSIKGCGYPVVSGIAGSLEANGHRYEIISVHGMKESIEILDCLRREELENVFLEISICKGSCLNGPAMPKNNDSYYLRQKRIKDYIQEKRQDQDKVQSKEITDINLNKVFIDKSITKEQADPEQLQKILRQMGKYEKSDELNCGACGYNTCQEKAQAVFEGMSQMTMCLPFMRSKAESVTNIIFENSPNIIFLLDEEMRVKEFNPTAEKIFGVKAKDIKDKPISLLIDDLNFHIVKETKLNLYQKKISYPQYGVVLIKNILYLEKENIMLVIMTNVTAQEKSQEELARVKENTLNAAQEVIEKQMRVAQEIASLLGETTAETKVTLTKLKDIVIGEAGEKR